MSTAKHDPYASEAETQDLLQKDSPEMLTGIREADLQILRRRIEDTTGGPAFPAHPSAMGDHDGMTLRDYFAAKAMQGFITNIDPGEERLIDVPQLAKSAYSIADTMLKAREA